MTNYEGGESEPYQHEVHMGEWKKAEYPDTLFTMGLSTCLGIAVLNKKKRTGYLGHFIPLEGQTMDFLEVILSEAESPEDLEVVLAGCGPVHESMEDGYKATGGLKGSMGAAFAEEEVRRYKEEVFGRLKEAEVTKVRNKISDKPATTEHSYEMTVDTAAGTIAVQLEDDPSGFDDD